MSDPARELVSRGLAAVAALALIGALAAGDVHHVVAGEDQFADRATAALQAPAVRDLVARRVTDDLVLRHAGDLLAARPLIEQVISSAVGSRAFADLFRAGVRDVHRAVLTRDQDTVTLSVADAGTVAAAALDVVRPSLAKRLRVEDRVRLLRDHLGAVGATMARLSGRTRLLTLLLGAVAILCAAGAVTVARDRRRAITALGVSIAVAGVLLAVAWQIGLTLVSGAVAGTQARAAVGAVWRAFLGDLRLEAWVTAGVGAVIAAASASLLAPVAIDAPLRAIGRRALAPPRNPWTAGLRAIVLIAIGVLCVVDRGAIIALLFTATGVYLVYSGVSVLLGLIAAPVAARGAQPAGSRIPGRRVALAVVVVALAAGAAVGGLAGSGALQAASPAPGPCDGSRALCARPLTDVALAATHNAMSVPLPGWYAPEQEAPIPDQLRAGIRGLLIDTHYAVRLGDGKLRTDLNAESRKLGGDGVSAEARRAAERLRARLGFRGSGPRGMYLCHGFCELGGTPLATVLAQIHDFLVANPMQVLVIINEDYVTPADFVAAVDRSGLGAMAYRGATSGRWPTLRQMIASGQRVVFLAEHHAGGAPWYRLAYRSITEETPYQFSSAGQLTDPARLAASCRANRGPARGAPLFLVNNWVSTDPVPLPSNAAKVNAEHPLLRRLRTCERRRHHLPNLVAVNFYEKGDVMGAVDALNGLR